MTYLDLKHFSLHTLSPSSLYLHQLTYLIQFQFNFLQRLLSCTTSNTNSMQTLLDTHEHVMKQLITSIKSNKFHHEVHLIIDIIIHVHLLVLF